MKSFGLESMFDKATADFSGMTLGHIWIEYFVQEAKVRVSFYFLLSFFSLLFSFYIKLDKGVSILYKTSIIVKLVLCETRYPNLEILRLMDF